MVNENGSRIFCSRNPFITVMVMVTCILCDGCLRCERQEIRNTREEEDRQC